MAASPKLPVLSIGDLRVVAARVVGWSVTAVLPHTADRRAVALMARLWKRTKTAPIRRLGGRILGTLPRRFNRQKAYDFAEKWYEAQAEVALGRLRTLHRSDWRVDIEVEGLDRLHEALQQGRGAVIWYMSFCSSFLLMRVLAEAGMPACHLSRASHGVARKSRLGVAFGARLFRAAEDRYLHQRIIFHDPSSPKYYRQLVDLLAANHPVTIRGDIASAESRLPASFLGSKFALAGGAPNIAFRANAPLLTAYVTRLGPFHYRVVIQEPVTEERTSRQEFARRAVWEYGRRLDEQLRSHPLDWEAWPWIENYRAEP